MISLEAIKYTLFSAVLVISLFTSLKTLFANESQREEWRMHLKRSIYFNRNSFKRLTTVSGWTCMVIALSMALFLLLDLVEAV